MISNKLDAVLISESHVTERSFFQIPGYCTYLTPHPDGSAHAGTAIIIRQHLKHSVIEPFTTSHLQATTIRVKDRGDYITLSAIYCPPRHIINEAMFTAYFKTLGNRFISGGDWNAKHTFWGSRYTHSRGRELKMSIDTNRLRPISTGEPTYWPTDFKKRPDLLDFFVTKNIGHLYTSIESSLDGSSDHSPVILEVSTIIPATEDSLEHLCNSRTDWESFGDYLTENINLKIPLKTADDVDNACIYITNTIQIAAWINTPHTNQVHPRVWLPFEIKTKIEEKRRLRRVWQTSRDVADKTRLNSAIKELKDILKTTSNNLMKNNLEKMCHTGRGEHSLWKATKNTLNQPIRHLPPIRTGNSWARTNEEKAEAFATHLASVFRPNEPLDSDDAEIDDILAQDLQLCLPLKPTSPREISQTIALLDTNKAPGFDLITPRVLKELPKKCLTFLANLFNAILRTCHFPEVWKVSQVIMIPKPGKPVEETSSYRPISLTPVLSKLWEKIFLTRLKVCLDEGDIIPTHQFGFRQQHSTVEQVHRVYHTIRQCLEKKEYCSAAFLDVQQAFDKVWHKGLLCKIKLYLPHSVYLILESYLKDRYFQVKQQDARSNFYTSTAGVPQGSVLGPVLYNIFTCDLPLSPDVTVATFADDAAFLSCNKDPNLASFHLQKQMDKTKKWLNKWRIKPSASKSQHITFTLKTGDCPVIKLGEEELPKTTCVKYLGFYMDRRLTWGDHIKHKRDELNNRFRNLLWLLGRQATLSLSNKIMVYCSILKPIWLYGIQIWGTACKSNIQIIQRAQNSMLRVIANAPWFVRNTEIHQHLSLPTVIEEINRYNSKHRKRLLSHPNPIANSILTMKKVKRLKRANVLDDVQI
ncbi:unnamed protein product [Euphydryas editha]|uniref:Reverse transcriptase domain-containing protein n=1 Tax=Euphydryas editha TaxID=104508 RepID=A0AAU9UCX7_EUPED|nr:unnamed protein product [Euphydryas editha]